MGHGLGVENICGHFALVFPGKMAEHILIPLLPGSQHYKLHRILAQLIHHISDEIKTFLVCKAGNNSNHHLLGIHLQPEFLLQSQFVLYLFLAEIHCIVISEQEFVRLGIVLMVINSVYNAPKGIGAGTHKPVQMLSVVGHLNLLCISLTHGGYCIRIHDAAL